MCLNSHTLEVVRALKALKLCRLLTVPHCTSSGLCTNCFPRDKEGLFLFPGIYKNCAVICSSLNSVIFTACDWCLPLQEIGRAVGIALMKQFGWQADLRDPDLEVMVLVCQMACCCFQNCPQNLLFCSVLPLQAGPWPLPPFVFLLLNLTRNHLVAPSTAFQWPLCAHLPEHLSSSHKS